MPDWRAYVREHLPPLTVGPARECEIAAELALQLEQAYADAMAGGMSEPEARRHAQGQLGNWNDLARAIDSAERRAAPQSTAGWLAGGLHDLRYAARFLRRNPGVAAIAALTLAFGIGGNTAVFTLVDAVALRSLPYREPQRLLAIETRKVQQPEIEPWTSALDFFDIRERTRAFSSVAAISPVWDMILTGRGEAERLECLFVSADFFPLLGVAPALGRTFRPEEDNRAKASNVAVLAHSFWQRRLGGRRDVIGQALALDGGTYTVIGVLPAAFRYPGEPLAGTATDIDVWLPLAANPLTGSARGLRFLKVIGRLAPGVSPERAHDEVRRTGMALAEQYPDTNRGFASDSQPLGAQVTGKLRVTMLLLLGTVGFVLLMACANVANLLLARAAARHKEISVRVALGASRFRLLRQLLVEGALLAAIGGASGLVVAWLGQRALIALAPAGLVQGREILLDARALLFTTAIVVLCALLAGLPPAWRVVRADIGNALREAGRSLTVALMLLVGAGLLIRSFQRLLDVDPGYDARNLVTISTQVPPSAGKPEQRTAIYRAVRDRLAAVPGVRGVAAVSRLPLMGRNLGSWIFVEGKSVPGEPGYEVEYRVATPDYFATMGIPLRAGRLFDTHDDANPGAVLLINETAARRFWPGESAVGKRIKLGMTPQRFPWITVVGVVGDVRHVGLDSDPLPEIYRPYALNPLYAPILVIRTEGLAAPLAGVLAAQVRAVSAEVPAYSVFLMQTLVERSTAQRRFVMMLLTGFALAALLLAGVGIYGTVSQSVIQRTQEIGLRMALGASPGAALGLVFRQGLRLLVAGIALGSLAAAGLTQLMRKLLFEVRPLDPVAFLGAAVTLAVFAVVASYLPARRATRVDPLEALRHDV